MSRPNQNDDDHDTQEDYECRRCRCGFDDIVAELSEQRDAAIARAERAERERDEAERLLDDAATSLETIATTAGGRGSLLVDMIDVRGYANSRARAAREAIAAIRARRGGRP